LRVGGSSRIMNKRELQITKDVVNILKQSFDPSKIIIFGSRAKKSNNGHADFDFAVEGRKPSLSVERKINRKIEKVSGLYKIDIVYTDSVDEEFRKLIFKTGKVLHERRA